MAKRKVANITIRVYPQTRRRLRELAVKNRMTIAKVVDYLAYLESLQT